MKTGPSRIANFFWVTAILAAGFAVRAVYLKQSGVIVDSDEAIVGLMAADIYKGRPIPIFYYGQNYMGSLEAILAAVLFHWFPQDGFILKMVPFLFSLWFILLVYSLSLRFTDRYGARCAAFFAAVGPVALIEWSTKARGGFIELVVLGTIALKHCSDLLSAKRVRPWSFFPLGFFLGIAWWVNNQAIFYLAAVALLLVVHFLPRYILRDNIKFGLVTLFGFSLGSLPFWYANAVVEPRWQTFHELGKGASFSEMLQHLGGLFTEALPILFGARRFWTTDDVFFGSTALAFAVYLIALAVFLLTGSAKGQKRKAPRGLLVAFLFLTPLIFAASYFGWLTKAPRYLLPLYSVLFVIAGTSVSTLRHSRVVGSSVFALFMLFGIAGINLASNYLGGVARAGQPFVAEGERVAEDHAPLYAWLKENSYSHIATNYWIGYRAAFETEERVTFSIFGEPRNVRIRRYADRKADYAEWLPYVLTSKQAARFGEWLSQRGYLYRRSQVGEYVVFDHVRPEFEGDREIEPAGSDLHVTSRAEWAPRLIDEERGTRWGSGKPQEPGMAIQIGLPQPRNLSRVNLDQAFWPQDVARELTISKTAPDGTECAVFDGEVGSRLEDSDWQLDVRFAPQPATALTITQQGRAEIFDWSVAELSIFEEPAPLKAIPDAEGAALRQSFLPPRPARLPQLAESRVGFRHK